MKTLQEVDYKRLPEIFGNFQGVGIPGLSAKLIERTEREALYYRWDDVWEVFRIKISPEAEIYGKKYPKRETYPSNEDFGRIAWCFKDEDRARRRYNTITEHSIDVDAQESDENGTEG